MLLFVILANKYGITTTIKLILLSELPRILDNKLSATNTKRQSILAHKYKITFLLHFFLSSGNFCRPNLSQSSYFSYIKERSELFLHIQLTNMELRIYLSFPRVVVASLALILRHSDYQWLLTTNNGHSVSPKTAKF